MEEGGVLDRVSPGSRKEGNGECGVCGDEELPPLSILLFGSEIVNRSEEEGDESVQDLETCIGMCIETVRMELGDSCAAEDAATEWENVLRFVDAKNLRGAHVLRAGLLIFLCREPAIALHFARREPGLVKDLTERVLPMLMPRFLANMAQSPDVLVTSVLMMCLMWDGVPIGAPVEEGEGGEGGEGERT